jgi:hypothetical protein
MLTTLSDHMAVGVAGVTYPAEAVSGGAAYEIFSTVPSDGFLPNPREAGSFRRFVHVTEAEVQHGDAPMPSDAPMCVPLGPAMSWSTAHRLSQSTATAHTPALRMMRETVAIRRGTRMIKVLSARQLAGCLRGWLPQGFCHREYDIAHLRTPADLAVLRTDNGGAEESAIFALRWRAIDPVDFDVPYTSAYHGLTAMSPHNRVGPPVLGTGFAPTNRHIVPEFVTADLVDLPLTANAELIAFTPDGTEVLLYRYIAEQRTWGRLFGKQWRHLLAEVDGVAADQEYFHVPNAPTQLIGLHDGSPYEAIADPRENEFLVLAKVRALRHHVTHPGRRTPRYMWRGVPCSLIRDAGEWLRLRLVRPNVEALERTGAVCIERGIYEAWAPAGEAIRDGEIVVLYP